MPRISTARNYNHQLVVPISAHKHEHKHKHEPQHYGEIQEMHQ